MNLTLSRRAFTAGAALLPIACTDAGKSALAPDTKPVGKPVNPLVRQRADAQIFRHTDGWYYMTASVPEYDRLVLRRSKTIAGLTDAEERVLWRHEESGPMSGFIWAPELHLVDNRWIMYFAAGPSGGGEDVFRIRTYAVVCDGPDPMTGNWTVLGEFKAPWDSFNLDSTIYTHRGTRYFCWAQREPGIETNSNIYIAPMKDALTLASAPARLTVPTLPWEIRGFKVNEGAAFIEHAGKLFMTYSASATDARYCLGLLSMHAEADIMDPKSWTKSQEPVFISCPETSVYGPGHNSFTVDEQDRPILVYHGRDYEAIEGDPLFNPDRHTRVQRLYFDASGNPDFGVPVGNGPLPDRFESAVRKGVFMAHEGTSTTAANVPIAQTQFRTPDAGDGTIRIVPILMRDSCLVASDDGSVKVVPQTEADSIPRGGRFRKEDADGGTVRFFSAADSSKALAITDTGLRLDDAGNLASHWRID